MPLFNLIMQRRNFLKKIIVFSLGIISMSNKLFAKELFSKEIFKDGIFYNNYIVFVKYPLYLKNKKILSRIYKKCFF